MGDDFNSPILDAAIALHEMFLTLVKAGFNEDQALFLVADVLRNTGKAGQ